MERKDELTLLGSKTEYRQDYAPEVLESFVNKHPGNDYWVRFNCPEFTSLCPITGQPDFAEIRISYLPLFVRAKIKQWTTTACTSTNVYTICICASHAIKTCCGHSFAKALRIF